MKFKKQFKALSLILAVLIIVSGTNTAAFAAGNDNSQSLGVSAQGTVVTPFSMTAAQFLQAQAEAITFDTIKGENSSSSDVKKNLKKPPSYSDDYAVKFTMTSNNTAVVKDDATVIRPAYGSANATVTITIKAEASFMFDDGTYLGAQTAGSSAIVVTVLALTQEEQETANAAGKVVVDYALNAVTIGELKLSDGTAMSPTAVDFDIKLVDPRDYYDRAIIPKQTVDYVSSGFWTSSDSSVIGINYLRGNVYRPNIGESDKTVTLTLTAQKGAYIDTKDFVVTIKALTQQDLDDEKQYLQAIADAIDFDVIKGSNSSGASAVTDNLQPVYRGIIGSGGTVEWVRSNNGSTGVKIEWTYGTGISYAAVTRPASGNVSSFAEAELSSIKYAKYISSHSQYVGNIKKEIPLVILGNNISGILSGIELDSISIESIDLVGNDFDYQTTVAASKDSITVSAAGVGAHISINGAPPVTENATVNVPLLVGENKIIITSNAGGSTPTLTYTLTITRPSIAAVAVSTRIEANDMTLVPKENTSVNNSTYNLTSYGFATNPAYPTAMHALITALEAAGLDSTDPSVLKQSGGWLTSICGLGDTGEGYWMYTINGEVPNDALAQCVLNPSDDLHFFFVTDYTTQYLSEFDKEQANVQAGQMLTLNLKGRSINDITWGVSAPLVPIKNAELLTSGNGVASADNSTGIITDVNGKSEISFSAPGVYLVSAVGTTTPITRPYCKVIVTEGMPVATDEDLVEEVKNALTLGDTSALTENIVLPLTGSSSTAITWQSSNPSAVTDTGAITRPAIGQADSAAVLTATIKKGSAQRQKSFNITVLALSTPTPQEGNPKEMLTDSKSYYWSIPNKQLTSMWDIGAVLGAWELAGFSSPDYSKKPEGNQVTDYAGQILSMIALGQNPYNDCEIDLPATLAAMQGANGQFSTQPNQQIWATIALTKAGASFNRDTAIKAIIDMQSTDGSIQGADMTGMALIALSANRDVEIANSAIVKAVDYLKVTQITTGNLAGGWSDNSNTIATVISGLTAAGEDVESWEHNPLIALSKFKHADGGFKFKLSNTESNSTATSQSVIAISDVVRGNSFWVQMSGVIPEINSGDIDKTLLQKRIAYAETLESSKYTAQSYKNLTEKISEAKTISSSTTATQAQVDAMMNVLNTAINNLQEKATGLISVSLAVNGDDKKGTIIDTDLEVSKNSSPFDALKKALTTEGISFRYSGSGSSVYIYSIDGLVEKSKGPNSGWLYTVNGSTPGESCGAYKLKNNDQIQFFFTTDYTEEASFSSGSGSQSTTQPDRSSYLGGRSGSTAVNAKPKVALSAVQKNATLITSGYKSASELSDWEVIGLVASGEKLSDKRLQAIKNTVKKSGGQFGTATDTARIALALQLSGQDIKNIESVNLLKAIYNNKDMGKQGMNGYIFSLLVMTNNEKDIPKDAFMTPSKARNKILASQNVDGGFPLAAGSLSNLDITAMTIVALAPYKNNEKVKAAMDKAITYLASQQQSDGGFSYSGVKSSETVSQIIIALGSAGINPDDSRFVKNSKTLMEVLNSYRLPDGEFRHILDGSSDKMATEQALLAMHAYISYFEGKPAIYRVKASAPIKTT